MSFKKTLDKRVLVYMNKKAWMSEAAWSYYIKEIKYTFKDKTTIIYCDNLSTNLKQSNLSTTNVNNIHLRCLISNSTHIMQQIGQHVGRFIQSQLHIFYKKLILKQGEKKTDKIKKLGIQNLREKLQNGLAIHGTN